MMYFSVLVHFQVSNSLRPLSRTCGDATYHRQFSLVIARLLEKDIQRQSGSDL
jgi:hypothetical protein